MKILQLVPRVPYPLTDGGAIGIFNITKYIALRGHTIRMLSFPQRGEYDVSPLRQFCDLKIIKGNTHHSVSKIVRSLVGSTPYTVLKYQHRSYKKALASELANSRYDVIHTDLLMMAPYAVWAKEQFGIPIVLREHNLESKLLARYVHNETNLFIKKFASVQANRLKSYEPHICEAFDACVMITKEDEDELQRMSLRVKTCVIPAGMDIPIKISAVHEIDKSILFLALLEWKPNIQGFLWFYKHILPLIVEKIPNVRIYIVGKGNSRELLHINSPNVEFIGFVESVIPWYERTQMCIVPLLTGSGIRIKILEMFSYQKAVVSTSIGCEGIEAENGRDLLVCDNPKEFADAVCRILNDKELRLKLGQNAQEVIKYKYSWNYVAEQFENVYLKVTGL